MAEEMECKDGFCEIKSAGPEVEPGNVFFEPVSEAHPPQPSKTTEDSKMRQRFLQFCDENPDHEECRIYDV